MHAKLTLIFELLFFNGEILFLSQVRPIVLVAIRNFVGVDVWFNVAESWSIHSNRWEIGLLLNILNLQIIPRHTLKLPCVIAIGRNLKYT